MENTRGANYNNMYIGYNRTGKSSVALLHAHLWVLNNPGGIVAGYDPQRRFRHLMDPRFTIMAGERDWFLDKKKERIKDKKLPLNRLRNALLIFDDYRGINRPATTFPELYALMEFRAEYNLDIIFVCHSPALVLEGLAPYISHYYIFYTKGRNAKFEDKIENYEECTAASDIIKKYIHDNPDFIKNPGQFYDEKTGLHKFPHIIVDTATGELIPQNIDKKWLKENWKSMQPQQ